jgi:hypothetical protein
LVGVEDVQDRRHEDDTVGRTETSFESWLLRVVEEHEIIDGHCLVERVGSRIRSTARHSVGRWAIVHIAAYDLISRFANHRSQAGMRYQLGTILYGVSVVDAGDLE